MSFLTEMQDAIGEIARETGEGLTATLLRFVGGDDTFDPATQDYQDGGVAEEQTFACPPVTERRGTRGETEVQRGVLVLIVPATDNTGAALAPRVGDRVRVGTTIYAITSVVPLNVGTGTAGYECEVRT